MTTEITVQQFAENIENKINEPLGNYLEEIDCNDLRDLLDFIHPYKIHNKIVDGANVFFSEYGQYSSKDTDTLIKSSVSELEEFADKLYEIWQPLDNFERNQEWISFNELIDSDETWSGAAIGALFGGIGALVGAWIGASIAEDRINEEVQEVLNYYLKGFSKYMEVYQETIQELIVPSFLNDIANQLELEQPKELASSYNDNITKSEQLDLLAKLGELKKNGIITEAEFQEKKKRILSQF